MTIQITVPQLPESVADAVLLEWHKQAGESVARDEVMVEVETDKVVLEVAAPQDGVLAEILRPAGSTVTAGEVLARMEESGAAATPADAPPSAADATPPAAADPPAAAPAAPPEDSPAAEAGAMSPSVRRLVDEHGLEAAQIHGSGHGGRIVREDVMAHLGDPATPPEAPPAAAPLVATAAAAATPERTETREPMSRLRQTIAARLVQVQQNAALLTTFNEVDMQPVMALRARHREEFEKTHGTRLGFMSFFVRAAVTALRKFPLVNANIDGSDIVYRNYYDIGIAVASPRGLVVPVLRDCVHLSLAEIEARIRDFGARAHDGSLALDDLRGGTFTITNGGVFGSLLSTPIVNPPQSAILGMHKIEDRPRAVDGEVVIRPMMFLAMSYDHRLIDGREAVQFLVTIKTLLEDPARMLLDL